MTELPSVYFGVTEITPPASMSADQPDREPNLVEGSGEQVNTAAETVVRNFATGAIAGRDRAQDLLTAVSWNSGEALFHAWHDKVNGALAAAYPVFLHLLGGGEEALKEVLHHPALPERQRRHKTNLALIALQLVAKPSDVAQAKAVSEYAAFLRYAAVHGVAPDAFSARMAGVTLKSCKEFVRRKARGCRSKIAPLTTPGPDAGIATGPAADALPPPRLSNALAPAATLPAAPSGIKEATAEKGIQSRFAPLEPAMTITVVGAMGKSRTLHLKLTARQAKASLALLDKERGRDPSRFLVSLGERMKMPNTPGRKESEKRRGPKTSRPKRQTCKVARPKR